MKKLLLLFPFIASIFFFSCGDDEPTNGTNGGTNELMINEYLARGSIQMNEFGDSTDWVEIYNPSSSSFTLNANEWSLSDADNEFTLYQSFTIPANGHLIFWCDGRDTIVNQIHTNFKLTAQGDEVTLRKIEGNSSTIVDSRYYFNADNGVSYGRYPDGSDNWSERSSTTPGSSNVD